MSERVLVCFERDLRSQGIPRDGSFDVNLLPELKDGIVLDPSYLQGVDVFVSYHARVTEKTLENAEDLQLIIRLGAGYNNIDIDACTDHGVAVTHIPQAPTEGVAQATIGLIIACANNLRGYDTRFRKEGWDISGEYNGRRLCQSTVGVIGMGQIGSRVVELLEPFEPMIQVYDPYVSETEMVDLEAELTGLDELLATSDFITIHVPLTDETRGMLGVEDFRRMKDSAYLINTSRGGIYPDADLAEAIRQGWISGAAIDVFENEETIKDNPLMNLDEKESLHCLFTPHSISSTEESDQIKFDTVLTAIDNLQAGEFPPNILNPEVYDDPVPESQLSPSFRLSDQ